MAPPNDALLFANVQLVAFNIESFCLIKTHSYSVECHFCKIQIVSLSCHVCHSQQSQASFQQWQDIRAIGFIHQHKELAPCGYFVEDKLVIWGYIEASQRLAKNPLLQTELLYLCSAAISVLSRKQLLPENY